ncbi:gibberellin-regulated protein 3-like [Argentina anserina]|uniref:gibberellin-regulated protein 3-like n=1 Tax=Argentina anserina TaxID=57926 RepID=UPI00217677EF|nr:gibberellin-regulated protein 3-like [Potentilla anserina]
MASRLLLVAAILIFCVAHVSADDAKVEDHESQAVVKGPNRRLLPYLNCEGLCKGRCSLHSRPNRCIRACGTCCVRCKCVPPGTAGNREVCGTCYTNMTTHGKRLKCP